MERQGAGLLIGRAVGNKAGTLRMGAVGRGLLALLLWLLALPAALAAPTRHYTVTGWTMEDGLPHPLVHAVARDREGFLWAGTWEGVVRFNGRSFTLFDRQNTPGVELSGVFVILPEADGGVLFGTAADGVYRYVDGAWQALGTGKARKLTVDALLRDRRDGALWIASAHRLLRLDVAGRLHDAGTTAGLPNAPIYSLAQQRDGSLLVGGEAGLYRITDGRASRWGGVGSGPVRKLASDGEGGWLVAGDDGLYWRHADGRREHVLRGQRVDAVARDGNGVLWMNLSSGALQRRDPDGSLHQLPIPGAVSKALLVDREGLVWVGSTDGLYRIADGIASGLTRRDGLASDYVRVVLQDPHGTIWIGDTNGLERWTPAGLQRVRLGTGEGQHDTSVLALAWRDDTLWVGTYDLGVYRLDRQGRVQGRIRLGDGAQPLVRALLPAADGSLWVGGSRGLMRQRAGTLQTVLDGGNQTETVQALFEDADGTLWIGSDQGLAARARDGRLRRWQPGKDFPAQFVFDFLRDAGGDLWIASDRGLLRMRNGRFTIYDHHHGLPRDKLFRILDDGVGNLWLSSNMGVFRVARSELDQVAAGSRSQLAVHVIDRSDGMPGSQVNGASQPAGWLARDGRLLFPTSAGLAVIDPAAGDGRNGAPPVAFERITVDGQPQPPGRALRLQPGANRLAIGYAGMSFRALDKLRYRYRLHGYDQGWTSATANNDAVYTRLPPGSYELEVQAMAMPMDWSRSERIGRAQMAIEVVPALWQRAWMRVLVGGLLLVGILLLGWWRIASLRRRQRQLNQIIAERTEELSEKNRQLEVASYRLQHLASHDELTGLPNRRAGDAHLLDAVARAQGEGLPLCVALLDIDRFKQVNDQHGHAAGDAVLQAFGGALAGFVAEWGLFAARFGGEEFLICMEELRLDDGARRMRELLARIAALDVVAEDGTVLRCTFSAGVAELAAGQAAHTLLAQADDRLLQAKQQGRNCVVAD